MLSPCTAAAVLAVCLGTAAGSAAPWNGADTPEADGPSASAAACAAAWLERDWDEEEPALVAFQNSLLQTHLLLYSEPVEDTHSEFKLNAQTKEMRLGTPAVQSAGPSATMRPPSKPELKEEGAPGASPIPAVGAAVPLSVTKVQEPPSWWRTADEATARTLQLFQLFWRKLKFPSNEDGRWIQWNKNDLMRAETMLSPAFMLFPVGFVLLVLALFYVSLPCCGAKATKETQSWNDMLGKSSEHTFMVKRGPMLTDRGT